MEWAKRGHTLVKMGWPSLCEGDWCSANGDVTREALDALAANGMFAMVSAWPLHTGPRQHVQKGGRGGD